MKVTDNKIEDLVVELTIEVAGEDYAQAEKKKLNDCRRKADIKGFRKGMAPMSLIQRLYGEQALVESVNEVISGALSDYITTNDLHTLGEPVLSESQEPVEWVDGNDFSFKFDIGIAPEVKFDLSKEDKLPYYKINITEQAKEEMKKNMLLQFGSTQEGEAVGEDDYVIADLRQEGKEVEGVYISIRNVSGEARDKFIGAKAGDSFPVNVNEAFENETDRAALLKVSKDELAGLDPNFEVSIVNVKTFVPAEPGQEFYDQCFGEGKVTDEEGFDKAVEERLAGNYRQEADYRLSSDLKKYLLDKAAISLPENFLRRWLVEANTGKYTEEQIDNDFPAFIEDFRWQMVRDFLMEKYSLKVEQADLHDAAIGYAAYQYAMYGLGNVPEQMLEEAASQILSDSRQSSRLVENIEEQKIIEAVRKDITLSNKKISVEKFRDLDKK